MLEEKDLERLKEIFVTQKECDETIDHQNRKFHNDDKRLHIIESYQKLMLRVLAAVGAGVLGILLEILFGGA